MINKYRHDSKGSLVKYIDIYTQDEHKISNNMFDAEAVTICDRLQLAGFEAYIVGGAVRDLLLGIEPKDFDIVTNAHPNRIKKIFGRLAMVIGHRFKLVHIRGTTGKIFEVATFRVKDAHSNNVYGTLEEDAYRRDFTLNSLYYDPKEERIHDFHEGYKHLRNRIIEPVVPLSYSFVEDPVRMVRAIKYAHSTSSKLSNSIVSAIKRNSRNLKSCSISRMSEELLKILAKAEVGDILRDCYEFKLLHNWLPILASYLDKLSKVARNAYFNELSIEGTRDSLNKSRILYTMLNQYIKEVETITSGNTDNVLSTLKMALSPIIMPNSLMIEVLTYCYSVANVPMKVSRKNESENNESVRPRKRRFRYFRPRKTSTNPS